MLTVIWFSANFLKSLKNVSFEKTSGRLNQISNDVSGSRYARRVHALWFRWRKNMKVVDGTENY